MSRLDEMFGEYVAVLLQNDNSFEDLVEKMQVFVGETAHPLAQWLMTYKQGKTGHPPAQQQQPAPRGVFTYIPPATPGTSGSSSSGT